MLVVVGVAEKDFPIFPKELDLYVAIAFSFIIINYFSNYTRQGSCEQWNYKAAFLK